MQVTEIECQVVETVDDLGEQLIGNASTIDDNHQGILQICLGVQVDEMSDILEGNASFGDFRRHDDELGN